MTAKGNELRKRIEALMEWNGINQPQLAEKIGVNQSLVSRWLSGSAMPSVEGFIRLGALAAESDPDGARFYWSQTGLDADLLLSVAEAMLRGGLGRQLLATADAILKARLSDRESLVSQGKGVLVPPYTEGEWRHQAPLSPVLVSGDAITNIASTYYLYVEPEGHGPWGQGFAPKDKIIFDSSEAISRRIEPFRNRNVVLNFTESWMPPVAMPHRPRGVYIGRLAVAKDRARLWLTLGAHDHHPILHGPGPLPLSVVTLLPLIPSGHREQVQRGTRYAEYPNVVDLTEEEVISQLTIPNGCEIMGRFLGLIDGGSTGGYETTDRTLRLIREQSRQEE